MMSVAVNTNASGLPTADDCSNGKLIANWIAAFAIAGFSVHRLEDGGFLVNRWNLTKHCPDLRTLIAFARQVGARA